MNIHSPVRAYTIKAVADMLQCRPSTIYAMIKRGELKCFKVGETKGLRVTAAEVERLMQTSVPVDTGGETGRSDAGTTSTLPSSVDLKLALASTGSV